MKNYKSILFGIYIAITFSMSGCMKEIDDPVASYTIRVKNPEGMVVLSSPYIVAPNQVIEFVNNGNADFYAFFSGMQGNIWADFNDLHNSTTIGADTNSNGSFTFSYPNPGNYTATVVLTNREVKNPLTMKQITIDFNIEVAIPASN